MTIRPRKEYCNAHGLMYPQDIVITHSDDGFYSLYPFVSGTGITEDGREVDVTMSDECGEQEFDVIEWS